MKNSIKHITRILPSVLFLGPLFFQPLTAETVRLILEHSTDMSDWEAIMVTPDMLDEGHVLHDLTGKSDCFRLIIDLDEGAEPEVMVFVEGGILPESSPLGAVSVGDILVGRYEVTWGEWKEVRAWAGGRDYDLVEAGQGCEDDHPVRALTWFEAVKWCNAKSEMNELTPVYRVGGSIYRSGEGNPVLNPAADGYRLPLEVEWEFAARGGNQSGSYTFAGSDELDMVGWYEGNSSNAACNLHSNKGTWPVGLKAPNELGLYDMSGNVREFCWDATGTLSNVRIRGGGWAEPASAAALTYRRWTGPGVVYFTNGLRLFRTAAP